jgi:hypothetical protein
MGRIGPIFKHGGENDCLCRTSSTFKRYPCGAFGNNQRGGGNSCIEQGTRATFSGLINMEERTHAVGRELRQRVRKMETGEARQRKRAGTPPAD